ncbi:MAG: glycosyltransferase family 2 protein [Rubrobacter sp.]|nr:glycosyltransferase family 2 protein [Rubrobacter sp.]
MDNFRLAGVLVAVLILGYGLSKYREGNGPKFDLLLTLFVSTSIASVSVFPSIGNVLTYALRLENRLFSLLVFSNLLLFAMFFFLLNQVRVSNRRSGDIVRALARQFYSERYSNRRRSHGEVGTVPKKGRLLIVIPAYNEQEAIRGVLARMPKEVLGYEVDTLVVVDGATDGTEAVAIEHNFPVATHIVNQGQGDALRTGFEIARVEGADIVVNMDADGQHESEEIERLVAPIINDEADFVLGSRFLGHYEERGSIRHVGIILFSWLVSVLSGRKFTDSCNGFRAIRGSLLYKLDLREDRLSAAELILEAVKKKLRIKEVPVSILRRAEGESKMPKRLGYPLGFLRVIIQTWLR